MTKTPDAIDVHVGRRIRMRRIECGLSQEKLAASLNLTFQQVQKYEKGTNRVGSSRLQKIADTLQTTVGYFFDGAPGQHATDPAPDSVSAFLATSDGVAIAQAFMRLPDGKLRRTIRDIVEGVADLQGRAA
jgi:transcriptional regulator with XRE-family HTH domain